MDQVFFSLKRAHHACLRFMRPLLAEFGLTPARFDLMSAMEIDPTQSGLQRILGLARSTISEMLARLEELGMIGRAKYRRTRVVWLKPRARALFQRALDRLLNSGVVPATVDDVVTFADVESDTFAARDAVEGICGMIRRTFGDFARAELYPWHPDEYLDALEYGAFGFSTTTT